jgi:hypothetical protein
MNQGVQGEMAVSDVIAAMRTRITAMAARLEKACCGHGTAGRVDSCPDCHEILQARRLLASLGHARPHDDAAAQQQYLGWDPRQSYPRSPVSAHGP